MKSFLLYYMILGVMAWATSLCSKSSEAAMYSTNSELTDPMLRPASSIFSIMR